MGCAYSTRQLRNIDGNLESQLSFGGVEGEHPSSHGSDSNTGLGTV